MQQAVVDAEHFARIFALRVFEPGVAIAERLAVEQADDVVGGRDGVFVAQFAPCDCSHAAQTMRRN